VLQYGVDRYADDLLAAGGAGLITPTSPPTPPTGSPPPSAPASIVFLAAPTSTDERLDLIARASTGFVYTVSTMGITGERAELDAAARGLVARLRDHGVRHACVGIGISTPSRSPGSWSTPTARSSARRSCGRCATAGSTLRAEARALAPHRPRAPPPP
jgi:tryptophan synthase alpha chain